MQTDDMVELKLQRNLALAKKCYNLARDRSFNDTFCKKMFMIGLLYNIGYEFEKDHNLAIKESCRLIELFGGSLDNATKNAIMYCGVNVTLDMQSDEWKILNIANLTTDNNGYDISIEKRLFETKKKYGDNSKEYNSLIEICSELNLLDIKKIYLSQSDLIVIDTLFKCAHRYISKDEYPELSEDEYSELNSDFQQIKNKIEK